VLILELAHVLDGDVAAPPLPLVAVLLGGAWGADRYARSGELFGLIGRGSTRLFSRDLIRESAVESASFLLGYLLGLPCCAFAPTAFKPVEMLGRNGRKLGGAPRLVDRILIWLLAPVALEASQYRGELLQADPTLAPQFLGAVRRRQATADVDVDQGGWSASANFTYHTPIWTGSNAALSSYDRLKDSVDYLRAIYNNGALAFHEIGEKQTQLNLGLGYRWGVQSNCWVRRTSLRVGVNNVQDREPTHSQAQTGYPGSMGSSLWVGRAYSLTYGRDF
jgi:hypothetical protein